MLTKQFDTRLKLTLQDFEMVTLDLVGNSFGCLDFPSRRVGVAPFGADFDRVSGNIPILNPARQIILGSTVGTSRIEISDAQFPSHVKNAVTVFPHRTDSVVGPQVLGMTEVNIAGTTQRR